MEATDCPLNRWYHKQRQVSVIEMSGWDTQTGEFFDGGRVMCVACSNDAGTSNHQSRTRTHHDASLSRQGRLIRRLVPLPRHVRTRR